MPRKLEPPRAFRMSQIELVEAGRLGIDDNKANRGISCSFADRSRLLWKIQTALEKAGVEFIPADDHKGPGVRLKERARTKLTRGRRKSD